jgi:FkbM family methyltransferase
MKILNRDVARYIRRIPEMHRYACYILKCLWMFKRPLRFLRAYLSAMGLPDGVVELRNGLTIHLSDDPDDVITVFVVFVREDYGKIPVRSVVVDVGANIGVFALYAAYRGARTVLAYEPNSETYRCLRKNSEANHLQQVITACQLAVTDRAGDRVRFPARASVYNAIMADGEKGDFEWVQTTNLQTILRDIPSVDLLKMDCEGAEYDILLSSPPDVLRKISEIRLEYHLGRAQELVAFLQGCGFKLTLSRADRETSGGMWFERI